MCLCLLDPIIVVTPFLEDYGSSNYKRTVLQSVEFLGISPSLAQWVTVPCPFHVELKYLSLKKRTVVREGVCHS